MDKERELFLYTLMLRMLDLMSLPHNTEYRNLQNDIKKEIVKLDKK